MSEEFWTMMNQIEAEETGSGIIGLVDVQVGYKVFVSGLGNDETWFPFDPADKVARQAAMNKARALGKPQLAYNFVIHRDSVKGREVTWEHDRHCTYPTWTDMTKQLVVPRMKELGLVAGRTYWLRMTWEQDPAGTTETGPDGEIRTRRNGVPSEVFSTEAAAAEAGQVQADRYEASLEADTSYTTTSASAEVPVWLVEYARSAMAGDPNETIENIAAKTGQSVELVKAALG